jgi:hypothetical protein
MQVSGAGTATTVSEVLLECGVILKGQESLGGVDGVRGGRGRDVQLWGPKTTELGAELVVRWGIHGILGLESRQEHQ